MDFISTAVEYTADLGKRADLVFRSIFMILSSRHDPGSLSRLHATDHDHGADEFG